MPASTSPTERPATEMACGIKDVSVIPSHDFEEPHGAVVINEHRFATGHSIQGPNER